MTRTVKRGASVAFGFVLWTLLDLLMGKSYNPEVAMIGGFVISWIIEPEIQH